MQALSHCLPGPHPISRVRYGVLAWLCLATVLAYLHRGCLAVAQKAVSADLGLSEAAMGDIMAAFFLTYALCQLPAGWLGQVMGTRRTLTLMAALWSACTGMMALAFGGPGLMVSRLGMGAGQAALFPCAVSTLGQWFPASQRATVSGVLGSCMGIGGAIGVALTGVLLLWMDWRWLFVCYALPGLLWAVGFSLWFRDRPEQHPGVNAAELALLRQGEAAREPAAQSSTHDSTPWRQIFVSPLMWWINAQQFLRAGANVFYLSWFPTYLMETRGVSTAEAGWLASMPFWAQVVGCLAGGVVADRVLARTGSRRLSRQGVPFVSLAICTGLILLSSLVANAWLAVLVITLGTFCASVAGPAAYAVSIDLGGRSVSAVFSVMNMAGNVGAILFPMVVPRLVKTTGSWELALYLFAGVYLGAAVCWLFINPNGTIVRTPDTTRN